MAEHDHGGPEQPDYEQHPARNERQRTILAAQSEIEDQAGADAGDGDERDTRKPRGRRRINDGEKDERKLEGDPAPEQRSDPAVPKPDAQEGVEKEHEARGKPRFGCRAIERGTVRSDGEELVPE